MTASFTDGKIKRLDVEGNGQSIYFVLEDDTIFTGMNKTLCTDMIFFFDSSEVNKINFLVNPEAQFIPPKELATPDKFLPGFIWFIDKRPKFEQFLFPSKPSKGLFLEIPEEGKLPENSTYDN